MNKKTFFFIDDVIWCLRDLTRNHPASMFDVPFFKMLKKAHDDYGMKVQLNLFYRTDFFYGNDEFTLADVTADYKKEWEDNSDWLKLAFHAKQEFPDYPYVNATYEDVKANFEDIKREVIRFAGEKTFTYNMTNHWLPMSKAGCQALYDCGVRILSASYGDRTEYNGDPNSLPYGHAMRLLHNRQPETMLFTRGGRDVAISRSICGHNHITQAQVDKTAFNFNSVLDPVTGMKFKRLGSGICLNLSTPDILRKQLSEHPNEIFLPVATHEQYFFSDYLAYQPDYAEKLYIYAEFAKKHGYEFIFADDLNELTETI